MDWVAISNISMALATLVLAFFTWLTIKQNRKQITFLHKQILLETNQKNPLLHIQSFSFEKNVLRFNIKNIGNGNAYKIGLLASFDLAQIIPSNGLFQYDATQIFDYDKNIKRKVESHKGCVNFISKGKTNVVILKPDQTIDAEVEPLFDLTYSRPWINNVGGRSITLKQLEELLKKNNKTFVNLSFGIVYKNAVEDMQDIVQMTEFVINIETQTTLEKGMKDGYGFQIAQADQNAMELKIGMLSYESYKGMKSAKNFIPEDKEE